MAPHGADAALLQIPDIGPMFTPLLMQVPGLIPDMAAQLGLRSQDLPALQAVASSPKAGLKVIQGLAHALAHRQNLPGGYEDIVHRAGGKTIAHNRGLQAYLLQDRAGHLLESDGDKKSLEQLKTDLSEAAGDQQKIVAALNSFWHGTARPARTDQERVMDKLRSLSRPQAEAEAARTDLRVQNNEFNTGRGLLPSGPSDTGTSYQDLLSPGFIPRLKSMGPKTRVLDSGAGAARAIFDLVNQGGFPEEARLAALEYSLKGIDASHFQGLKALLRDRFELYVGDIQNFQSRWSDYFTHILDVYGPFAYMRRPDLALRIYGKWLRVGGVLDTLYDEQRLIFNGGDSLVLPNFIVFDEDGREATRDWLDSIRGLKVLQEDSLPRKPFLVGGHYQDVYRRIRSAQTAPGGEKFSVFKADGFEFIHTPKEQIDISRPLAMRKTDKTIAVPPLEEIGYLDGRPPIRIFRWTRHTARH